MFLYFLFGWVDSNKLVQQKRRENLFKAIYIYMQYTVYINIWCHLNVYVKLNNRCFDRVSYIFVANKIFEIFEQQVVYFLLVDWLNTNIF